MFLIWKLIVDFFKHIWYICIADKRFIWWTIIRRYRHVSFFWCLLRLCANTVLLWLPIMARSYQNRFCLRISLTVDCRFMRFLFIIVASDLPVSVYAIYKSVFAPCSHMTEEEIRVKKLKNRWLLSWWGVPAQVRMIFLIKSLIPLAAAHMYCRSTSRSWDVMVL